MSANTKPLDRIVHRASWALFYREFVLPGMPPAEAGPAMVWMDINDRFCVTRRLIKIAKNEVSLGLHPGLFAQQNPRVLSLDPFDHQEALFIGTLPENLIHHQWRGGDFPKTDADVVAVYHLTHYFPKLPAREAAYRIFCEVFGGGAVYDKGVLQVPS